MIRQEEIDDNVIAQLAEFIATHGVRGESPSWHKLFILARRVNAPVWEVRDILAEQGTDEPRASKRTWLIRALMVEFAEAQAVQIQMQHSRRERPLIEVAKMVS